MRLRRNLQEIDDRRVRGVMMSYLDGTNQHINSVFGAIGSYQNEREGEMRGAAQILATLRGYGDQHRFAELAQWFDLFFANPGMRLYGVREFLATKTATDDVSERFGLQPGGVSAADVLKLIAGHHDMESLERTPDGSSLIVQDRRDWKFGHISATELKQRLSRRHLMSTGRKE